MARSALKANAADLRQKLDQATRNILEVTNPSLIKAMEERYAEDERKLAALETEMSRLPPPARREPADVEAEIEAAMTLFDEIERLAENPAANEAINCMLERIGLRVGLYFENGLKGKRKVRKVSKGVLALGNMPLPVPLYGEPQVVVTPSPNLEPGLVRESSCPLRGWKGFSDEEATQCRADRGLASAG